MKILVSHKDHPSLNTGYARSLNEIWVKRLSKKYEIGIYAPVSATFFPDKINSIPIFKGDLNKDIPTGEVSLLKIYKSFSADLYFTESDFSVFDKTYDFAKKGLIKWLALVPIDFEPIPDFVFEKLKCVNGIIPMCKWAKQKLKSDLSNVKDFVYHGVDSSLYKPLGASKTEIRKKFAPSLVKEDEFLIIIVQKNAANKAYIEQLTGIKKFIDENPDLKVKIYIHAHPIGYFKLFDLVAQLGLRKNCAFPDPQRYINNIYTEKDLVLFYNLADVCLNASAEGFGLPALEAMACGTPVIGLDWGASKELLEITPELRVKIGQYKISSKGIKKPFPDSADIAKKLAIVAKKGASAYSKKVRKHAEKFSWDKTANKIDKILNEFQLRVKL